MTPLSVISITFLGTASAQPSATRNHSSLALRLDSDVWLFDCGEATQHRVQKSVIKMGKIQKIFITHTHGDHIFGLAPLLSSRLNGAGGVIPGQDDSRAKVGVSQQVGSSSPFTENAVQPIEIYGPLGTRAYLRASLTYTHTLVDAPFVVHELRMPSDPQEGDLIDLPLHPAESAHGRNISQVNGVWNVIYRDEAVTVSAAPILHSVPCVGYVVVEAPVPGKMDPKQYIPHIKRTNAPMSTMSRLQKGETVTLPDGTILHGPERRKGRKIVILGDTYDPSPIVTMAEDADLLIHEATNSHLPGIDPNTKESDTYESVEARSKSRGHSTPQMAGAFAKRIRARKLILNHFSARYPSFQCAEAGNMVSAIADLASQEYGREVICAEDLMSIHIPLESVP